MLVIQKAQVGWETIFPAALYELAFGLNLYPLTPPS